MPLFAIRTAAPKHPGWEQRGRMPNNTERKSRLSPASSEKINCKSRKCSGVPAYMEGWEGSRTHPTQQSKKTCLQEIPALCQKPEKTFLKVKMEPITKVLILLNYRCC